MKTSNKMVTPKTDELKESQRAGREQVSYLFKLWIRENRVVKGSRCLVAHKLTDRKGDPLRPNAPHWPRYMDYTLGQTGTVLELSHQACSVRLRFRVNVAFGTDEYSALNTSWWYPYESLIPVDDVEGGEVPEK